MKKFCVIMALVFGVITSTGCVGLRSNIKRHAVWYGMAAGAIGGTSYALATRRVCKDSYDGMPYNGTPPCPK